MSKEVLATDIDEVLFPFVTEFSKWHNTEYGTNLDPNIFTSYEFEEVLQIPPAESVHRIRKFISQDHAHLDVTPLEDSQDSLARLSDVYRLVAITARAPEFESPTKAYLTHHFGETIGDITLVGHALTVDVLRSKAEVCKEVGATALVDDSVHHVVGCVEAQIGGILFGSYPWNVVRKLPDSVVECRNWPEVAEHFNV